MFSHDNNYGFLYEVCTLSSSRHAWWRKMQDHPDIFGWSETDIVVIGGVAYFLTADAFVAAVVGNQAFERGCIASFDLEMEEWRPTIKGPQSIFLHNAVDMHDNHDKPNQKQFTLAILNGSLVMVHGLAPYMDLWFLVDFEKGLWVKQYSIQVERIGDLLPMYPLSVLEDGRIVILIRYTQLEIYDPRTHTFTNVLKVSHGSRVSMYTGNLLSLEW
uniref:F-box associated domain-containing protein n=1 Tax=Arundo donax TaxID=35708 RepID=A0A0A9FDM9_ARUDO